MGYRVVYSDDFLAHHGVKGQKWGVRRYQNKDGTLTNAGKLRYIQNPDGSYKKLSRKERNARIEAKRSQTISELSKKYDDSYAKEKKRYAKSEQGIAYKKWRKQHPDEDEDHFYDYMQEHKIKDFVWNVDSVSYNDACKLGRKYVKNETRDTALIAALTAAPMVSIAMAAITKSGKKAAIAYLATTGTLTAMTYKKARKSHVDAETKYGLRENKKTAVTQNKNKNARQEIYDKYHMLVEPNRIEYNNGGKSPYKK